jgi:selenocysteine-specific elongation factor
MVMSYTIVGVTGHIDHGKSTLVRVLTGVDTDTHPEEKRRGITIDLGFAAFREGEHRFALIDAPGHQKYIGNLLAGVSAIDLGFLVVACDQGIQQQTLEHAAIVKSLGVRNLIVVVTRIDLVSENAIEELSEELAVFLDDFGFDEIPIVPISSVTGAGIDQLKALMCDYASRKSNIDRVQLASHANFRLPIDRVFNVPGRGLVVAGTIWSGEVRVGDMLEVAGTTLVLRVRELEVHGEAVESSSVGLRTAINLAGGAGVEIQRGQELVTPGSHPRCCRFVVALDMFADATDLRCPATVQLHTATQSCSARIIGARQLQHGTHAIVVVDTEYPIVATQSQACLFRLPYPVGSFAGGRVLANIHRERVKTKSLVELGQNLEAVDAAERLAAWVAFHGEIAVDAKSLVSDLAMSFDQVEPCVQSLVGKQSAILIGDRLVSIVAAERARHFIRKIIEERTQNSDDLWLVENSIVERASSVGSTALLTWTIDQLVEDKLLVRLNNLLAIASERTQLSKKQRAGMEQLLKWFSDNRSPPTLKEAAQQLQMTLDAASSLIRFATQQRSLVDLGQGFYISTQVFQTLCRELKALFEIAPEQPVAAIRDQWQVTRKHAIPLLEYCDRQGITIRRDILRSAGRELDKHCSEEGRPQNVAE